MGKRLHILRVVAISGCLMSTACATVDMTDVASKSATPASKSIDVNVVQRATSKLYSVFTNRGFVAKTSRKKMHSAARMLLKGLEDKPLSEDVNYVSSVGSIQAVQSDIVLAQTHVDQTRKAAEIYLAMAPGETSLRKELVSLEKALVAASEAKRSFSDALDVYGSAESDNHFVAYETSLNALREVTDTFGVRVRATARAGASSAIG